MALLGTPTWRQLCAQHQAPAHSALCQARPNLPFCLCVSWSIHLHQTFPLGVVPCSSTSMTGHNLPTGSCHCPSTPMTGHNLPTGSCPCPSTPMTGHELLTTATSWFSVCSLDQQYQRHLGTWGDTHVGGSDQLNQASSVATHPPGDSAAW